MEKAVKVTNKGMISIPAAIRKKHGIKDGDSVIIRENDDGSINILPIESVETLRQQALKTKEFKEIYYRSREEDIVGEK
ncbi:MAG: AbrB/MazE/SpoVT family DNA-binding domain-containing protein [Candidatus Hodarchaeales archaeon]